MHACRILSLLVTLLLVGELLYLIRPSNIFVVTQDSCLYRAIVALVWSCVPPVVPYEVRFDLSAINTSFQRVGCMRCTL